MNGPLFSAAVVGAGPAGLAAALRLQGLGAAVTVFESAPAAGGRACTDTVGGFHVDPAVQLFSGGYANLLRVANAVGATSLLERSPGRDALWRKGRAHEVVYGSPASMLASGALPLTLKLRMGTQYLPFLQRHGASLDPAALERAAAAGLDAESAAAWGQRELGRDFVDLLAAPLLATLYGTEPEEASAGFYHALAYQGMNLQVLAPRGGVGAFARACADRIAAGLGSLRYSTPVRAVDTDGGGVQVSGEGWTERFDAAVVALPAPAAVRVAKFLTPQGAERLQRVRVRPAASLALLLERPAGVRWFGLSFARGESRVAAALCVQENKVPGLVPPGKGLVVAFAHPRTAERLAGADAQGALRELMPEVARVFPRIEASIRETRLYNFDHGWTVFYPGHLAALPALRAAAFDAADRVALAGDYLYAPTVEGAVTAGLAAAERVASRLVPKP